MKHFVKWTLLFVMVAFVGFGATVLATQSSRLSQLLSQEQAGMQDAALRADLAQTQQPAPEETIVETIAESVVAEPALTASDVPDAPLAQVSTGAPVANIEQAPLPQAPGTLLNAVGTLEVAHGRQVVLAANGRVDEIAVEVGDTVRAGDLLIALDTTYLDWSLEQAEINFETARISFEELGESVLDSDIAVAQANLLLAQENLVLAQRGPSAEEMAAATAAAASAWARLEELREQPTLAQINQARAALRRAEITVEGAQREYDRIAWLPEAGATAAADALQRATVDLEAAKAAFEEVNQPATESAIQQAMSTAQAAQESLNRLREQPTPAQVADAEARLAAAQAAFDTIHLGPKESDLRRGELSVREAMIGLEQARLALDNSRILAPIDGMVLSIDVDLGEQASAGSVVATLADPLDVRLVVNVEQRDIRHVSTGQGVEISIYALPDATFLGVVDKIAPIAGSGTGFVTFPVIIQIVDGPLERVLPGMTAAANFLPNDLPASDASDDATDDGDAAVTDEDPAVETEADAGVEDEAAASEDTDGEVDEDADDEAGDDSSEDMPDDTTGTSETEETEEDE